MARRFARLGRVPGCEFGRFWPKATDLDQELLAVELALRTFAADLDPYGSASGPGPAPGGAFYDDAHAHDPDDQREPNDHHHDDDHDYPQHPDDDDLDDGSGTGGDEADGGDPDGARPPDFLEAGGRRAKGGGTVACKLVAARVAWPRGPSFDPLPYLSDLELAGAYADPGVLRLPARAPAYPPGKLHATKEEFAAFLRKWDAVGSLLLVPAATVPRAVRCGAFGVPKDAHAERFIINPTAVNSTM